MGLLFGVDFDTERVRIGAYDPEQGRLIAIAEAPYPTTCPRAAWAEQHPPDWWAAFVQATHQLFDAGCPRDVQAIAIAADAATVVFAQADGTPVRPAIVWADTRADAEAALTGTIEHPVLNYSGGGASPEWLVPKAMWVSRHELPTYAAAEVIADKIDYINFRLTGTWAASRLNATCKWHYDPLNGKFHADLFEDLGVPGLIEKMPGRVLPVGEPIGPVRDDVAAECGFSGAPLVVQGGIDAHLSMLGAATLDEGEMLIAGLSSVVHLCHTRQPHYMPGIWGPYPHALLDDHWIIEGGQIAGESAIGWLVDKIYQLDDIGHRKLIAAASDLEPFSTGLLALDHWNGSRTPYRDPRLRGALLGMSLAHDRVSLYRATVEAVALGTANVARSFVVDGGVPVSRVVVGGSMWQNRLWLQATADALGLPLHLTHKPITVMAGVILGACATGHGDSFMTIAREMVSYGTVIEPDLENHQRYQERLTRYREATELLAPLLRHLADTETD